MNSAMKNNNHKCVLILILQWFWGVMWLWRLE